MYQYFFEGDTVRLAYWRIDYGENKSMYANTPECKLEIVEMLTEQGYTPTVSEIDQTGNEWIDGMCFTDHDAVEAALAAGCKSFICDGDMDAVVDTVTAMNDSMFHVDADNVWHITVPSVPSLLCYNVMVCVTANSVDGQMISINNGKAIPLMKSAIDPVNAYDVKASSVTPLAVQINITGDKAYLNASANEAWQLGEIKTFGYRRPVVESELLCDSTAITEEEYPELFDIIKGTYAFPAEYIVYSDVKLDRIIKINGVLYGVDSEKIYRSTDGKAWESIYNGPTAGNDTIRSLDILEANGYLYRVDAIGPNSTSMTLSVSRFDGVSAFEPCISIANTERGGSASIAYSQDSNTWLMLVYIAYAYPRLKQYKSTDGITWELVGEPNTLVSRYVHYMPKYKRFILCTSDGVFTTDDVNTLITKTQTFTVTNLRESSRYVDDDYVYIESGTGIYAFTPSDRVFISKPAELQSAGGSLVYADNIEKIVYLNSEGVAAIDKDNLCFNYATPNNGAPVTLESGAVYDATSEYIMLPSTRGVLVVDASLAALPCANQNGYTYIKAK